jgi:3-phosphoinositide dependent protein kinase-1
MTNFSQRDKHLTFEDPKSTSGDPGFSTRSTQEWLDFLEDVKEHALSQRLALTNTYTGGVDSINGLSSSTDTSTVASSTPNDSMPHGRNTLHKEPRGVDNAERGQVRDGKAGRKRFSRRHSKNGLAAVF